MAKLNLTSGETIDAVPMLVAVHGYAVNSIELTGEDVSALRRLFERDPAGFQAFIVQFEARFPENRNPIHVADRPPAPSTHVAPIGYATVRVEDTCDGLMINADDMKRLGLQYDVHYEGHFLADGRYRIAIPSPAPEKHVAPQFLPTEDGEFNGNEQQEPDLSALEEIKYLACTAGAPGHMPVPKALARILTLCNRAGVTKKLDELRPLFATTEGSADAS